MQENRQKFTEVEVKNFSLYKNAGHSIKDTAEYFNVGYRDVLHYLIYYGYYTPTKKYNNVVNLCSKHDYFKTIDNSDKAYYLGLLMSDGCIQSNLYNKEIGLALKSEDKYLLDKLNSIVSPNKKVSKYKNSYKWKVVSPEMYNNLQQYGITENKSHSEYAYPNIPIQFDNDFIRGYFDGDGCISIKSTGYIVISICSNSLLFLQTLADKLNAYGIKTRPIFSSNRNRKNTFHTLYIAGKENKKKFKDFLYTDASTYMKRKYLRFMEIPC